MPSADFQQFIVWAFYGIVSSCAIYMVRLAGKLQTSIEELNVKIAVVIVRSENQEKTLDIHAKDIEALKGRK